MNKIIIQNRYASDEGIKEFAQSPETGCCSSIHPCNREFWQHIRAMFHCDGAEEVCGIVVKEDGAVQARIRRIPVLKRKA
jgi:hypothetical protein